MIFIDTSALLAFAVRTDALHSRALAWSKVLSERLVTTDFVLVEFTNHLSSVSRRGLVPPILQWALTDSAVEVVPPTRELFSSGMDYGKPRPNTRQWLTSGD